jgi:hypothetical protein
VFCYVGHLLPYLHHRGLGRSPHGVWGSWARASGFKLRGDTEIHQQEWKNTMSHGKACWVTTRGPLVASGTSLSLGDPRGVTEKLRERLSRARPQSCKVYKARAAFQRGG